MFLTGCLLIAGCAGLAMGFPQTATLFWVLVRDWQAGALQWLFFSVMNLSVLCCLLLTASPLGGVRLGGAEARPEFGYLSWTAMMFAAGAGAGLLLYGAAEPLAHFVSAIAGENLENGVRIDWAPLNISTGDDAAARDLAMAAAVFHWGPHLWSVHAMVGLAAAFFCYNRGLPLSIRSALEPLLGDRVWGWRGEAIDGLAIAATLFGLAAALGYGAELINAGLHDLFGAPVSATWRAALILAFTAAAAAATASGLRLGMKPLSVATLTLAGLLLLFVLAAGPTAEVAAGVIDGMAAYGRSLIPLSLPLGRADANFTQGWTAFYWAWWISCRRSSDCSSPGFPGAGRCGRW